ncbi:transposase [Actinomadura terrae]|uniref:transposase n=1 Tax=Actinomadura terrae TaxID=604353 RepID=UPI00355700DA
MRARGGPPNSRSPFTPCHQDRYGTTFSGDEAVQPDWRAMAILGPLLPVARRPGRPSKWTKRQLIDGIHWRVRTGAPWRDVPECYGSWPAVYGLFRRWQREGIWARIPPAPSAGAGRRGRTDRLEGKRRLHHHAAH